MLDRETSHLKEALAIRYAELVYNGQETLPVREALDAFVASTQRNVTGTVRLKLYKGNASPAGTWADKSLYLKNLASFTDSDLRPEGRGVGFIRLFGLPMKVSGIVERNTKKK